jgi:hypothetical protein
VHTCAFQLSLIDKEKKVSMMKDVELKKAQCEISKLKSDLVSEQTSRKRSRIEFEKDLVTVQGEKEVSTCSSYVL